MHINHSESYVYLNKCT